MTREEAYKILSNGLLKSTDHEWATAFQMAIKALEQPEVIRCGEKMRLINRDALIEEIARRDTTDGTVKVFSGNEIINIARGLPTDIKAINTVIGQWIPISERLPKENGRYLVSGEWKDGKKDVGSCEYYVWGGCFEVASGFRVVAWMACPEPYEEEKDG